MKKFSFIKWFRKTRQKTKSFAMRRAAHLRLGQRGENLAFRLLQELGLEFLTRNYAGDKGEIDLIARDGAVLCFIEVKTRHRQRLARPADAVGPEKRRRLVKTAHQYLRELGRPPVRYRFDIIEVVFDEARCVDLRYHRNAFTENEIHRPFGSVFPAGMPEAVAAAPPGRD